VTRHTRIAVELSAVEIEACLIGLARIVGDRELGSTIQSQADRANRRLLEARAILVPPDHPKQFVRTTRRPRPDIGPSGIL
jgi:hypothetical protein